MKSFLAIVLIVSLGVALGIGVAAQRIRTMPWNPALDQGGWDEEAPKHPTNEAAPKAVERKLGADEK
jgi:hypothetical protein